MDGGVGGVFGGSRERFETNDHSSLDLSRSITFPGGKSRDSERQYYRTWDLVSLSALLFRIFTPLLS